jgi:hypothetical protein
MSDIVNDEVEQAFREGLEHGRLNALAAAEYNAHENPVQIAIEDLHEKQMKAFENNLMVTLSVKYDINCNKEELQKALRYDRDTYCKGFKVGYEKRKSEYMSHWVISTDGYYPYCSECGYRPKEMTRYCPDCGRMMRGSDEKQKSSEAAREEAEAGVQESGAGVQESGAREKV